MNLVISQKFQPTFDRLEHKLPASLLLHGVPGVGVHTVARELGSKFAIVLEPRTAKGDIDHTSGTISVEKIRGLYEQTRGQGNDIIVILSSERMSEAAQNALLKLLEEPNSTTKFILTSHHPERLLPTIRSRVQSHHVPPLDTAESRRHLLRHKHLDDRARQQVIFVAHGRPELIDELANDSTRLAELSETMRTAREFLSGDSLYTRSIIAYTSGVSRRQALDLCDAAIAILQHTISTTAQLDSLTRADRLADTRDRIEQNANPRLQLLQFTLS